MPINVFAEDNNKLDISQVGNDDYYWLWDSAQLIIQDEKSNEYIN